MPLFLHGVWWRILLCTYFVSCLVREYTQRLRSRSVRVELISLCDAAPFVVRPTVLCIFTIFAVMISSSGKSFIFLVLCRNRFLGSRAIRSSFYSSLFRQPCHSFSLLLRSLCVCAMEFRSVGATINPIKTTLWRIQKGSRCASEWVSVFDACKAQITALELYALLWREHKM